MAGLKDKYCIVGVGETEYSKRSNRSTRAMAVEAIKKAMGDAGLKACLLYTSPSPRDRG